MLATSDRTIRNRAGAPAFLFATLASVRTSGLLVVHVELAPRRGFDRDYARRQPACDLQRD